MKKLLLILLCLPLIGFGQKIEEKSDKFSVTVNLCYPSDHIPKTAVYLVEINNDNLFYKIYDKDPDYGDGKLTFNNIPDGIYTAISIVYYKNVYHHNTKFQSNLPEFIVSGFTYEDLLDGDSINNEKTYKLEYAYDKLYPFEVNRNIKTEFKMGCYDVTETDINRYISLNIVKDITKILFDTLKNDSEKLLEVEYIKKYEAKGVNYRAIYKKKDGEEVINATGDYSLGGYDKLIESSPVKWIGKERIPVNFFTPRNDGKVTGFVIVQITVNPEGSVILAQIVPSLGDRKTTSNDPILIKNSIYAAKQSKFQVGDTNDIGYIIYKFDLH